MLLRKIAKLAVRRGSWVLLAVVVLAGGVGWLAAEAPGLISGAVGALLGGGFMLLTAVTTLLAIRVARQDTTSGVFYGVLLGGEFLKVVIGVSAIALCSLALWQRPLVFGIAILVGVVAVVATEISAFVSARSRS